jgi:hypothetical protein
MSVILQLPANTKRADWALYNMLGWVLMAEQTNGDTDPPLILHLQQYPAGIYHKGSYRSSELSVTVFQKLNFIYYAFIHSYWLFCVGYCFQNTSPSN